MRLTGERLRLSDSRGRSNPWRILALLALIGVGVLLIWLRDRGQVQPLFLATPTATRSATTYHQEAQAHFIAGDLDKAISAYGNAVEVYQQNADLWAELARVQTYSSDLLTTLRDRQARLNEARQSIDNAVEVDPENSFAYAIRALVYDWSASAEVRDPIGVGDNVYVIATLGDDGRLAANMIELADLAALSESEATPEGERAISFSGIIEASGEDEWVVSGRSLQISPFTEIREGNRRESFLTEARLSATKARQLDQTNSLALALLAEVLVDQQNVAQAADLAQTAVERATEAGADDPYLMDIYRVNGTVLEHQGLYLRAIEEYKKATHINPNLTFLYLKIGANYRTLRDIDSALDNFAKAAKINEQLGIEDPNPYLAIGRTYMQDGEFFVSALNTERALAIDPANPEIYARLASVYFQARNYESAIPVFKCALDGCTAEEVGDLLCELGVYNCEPGSEVASQLGQVVPGMILSDETLEYYYTYGSALTFYAGDEDHPTSCEDAERVFVSLMVKYGREPLVAAIVAEGRAICTSPGAPPLPTPEPTSTPTA